MKRKINFVTQNMSSMLWRTSESALPHVLHIPLKKKTRCISLEPVSQLSGNEKNFLLCLFCTIPLFTRCLLKRQCCLSNLCDVSAFRRFRPTNTGRQAGANSSKCVFSLFQVFGFFTCTMYNRPSRKSREPKPGVFAGGEIRLFF